MAENYLSQPGSFTENCPCNYCGSWDSRRLYSECYQIGGGQVELGIVKCRKCDLVYVSPRLSPKATNYVYEGDTEMTISHNYCWNGPADGQRFHGILGRLRRIQPSGHLLDIGCGVGQFLAEAKRQSGWTVVGLEPNKIAAETARRTVDCLVHDTTIDKAPLEVGSFNVITLFGVLEHVHDPRGVLQHVHRLLKPGGVLAAYVPNFHYLRLKDTGPVARFRTGRPSNLYPQEHLFQYTPSSVSQMLKLTGFHCLRMDIGRPFCTGGRMRNFFKWVAYYLACGLRFVSRVHFGGIEILARRVSEDRFSGSLRHLTP